MTRPLRILHTADSHIGADLPARPRHDRPRRGDDLLGSFERVLLNANPDSVDLVIHAGDLFDTPRPSSRAIVAATGPLLNVASKEIPVIIVPGNHERSSIPSAVFLSHKNIHIVTEPITIPLILRGHRVSITSFPCLRRDSARRFPLALAQTKWEKHRADLRILAVHQTFDSATCGPANYRFRVGDDVIAREDIPDAFDYVAAGHIHRHQTLTSKDDGRPTIVYSGSPDRVSFAEMQEPKGHVIVEANGKGLVPKFVEHKVRPMSIHSIDVTDLTCKTIRAQVESILTDLPPDAIAQLRLTGSPGSENLRGLRLGELARSTRPDVLFTVTARAVDFRAKSSIRFTKRKAESVFEKLGSCNRQTLAGEPNDLKFLPTSHGVYAMHDAQNRLLYIGKSKNLRTRVRSHFRDTSKGNHFGGWTSDVARIHFRVAKSELEALLVEAQLIQRLSPPFNRHMRGTPRYCYLCENGSPHHQLSVCAQPTTTQRSFGPYRSKHQAQTLIQVLASHFGVALCPDAAPSKNLLPFMQNADAAKLCDRHYMRQCSGPCANQVTDAEYDTQIQKRNDLLNGIDDTTVSEAEQQLEATGPLELLKTEDWNERPASALERDISMLRATYGYGSLLRDSERLLSGVLVLPESDEARTIVFLARTGARFDSLIHGAADARRILRKTKEGSRARTAPTKVRLPTTVLDAFCIIVRELRKESGLYRFVSQDELQSLSPEGFLAKAFE